MPKNILITGATGFVGSHTAEKLAAEGHRVKALVRPTSSLKWIEGKDIETVEGALTEAESLRDAMQGIDTIIHIAGVTAARNKEEFYKGNVEATRHLLEAAKMYAPNLERFVHISSQTAGGPSPEGILRTEDMPASPLTTYGKTKRMSEEIVEHYADYFPGTILRLPVVYGPRDPAVLTFFQTVSKGLKPLIGFQDKFVNLLYATDIADAIALAASSDAAKNRLYNIGAPEHYSWRELSDLAARVMNKRGLFLNIPHSAVAVVAALSEAASKFKKKPSVVNWEKRLDITEGRWMFDTSRAQKELGFRPSLTNEEGFRKTIEWYKQEKWM
jgi:nucleoside-diphosphate-sugar epimerase